MKTNPNTRLIPITDNGSLCSCICVTFSFGNSLCLSSSNVNDLTPSGIITTNAVPTSKPAPSTVIFFNFSYKTNKIKSIISYCKLWFTSERLKNNGIEPAKKEPISITTTKDMSINVSSMLLLLILLLLY